MSQFINKREDIVKEAVSGVIAAAGGRLARLDGFPHIRVAHRADWDKSKVALISGGGSGHEPAQAGFVGPGMLTAAVCGDVFASPSVDAVLAGILSVTGEPGCLLIVTNYTGDRLNFGLAAERARAMGLKVEIVFVADDIALPDLPQPRGLAGTLLVHKIAGALSEQGDDLAAVTKAAKRVIAGTKSIGMSLDTCSVPGAEKEDRIPADKAELGLGIHGEPGVEQVAYTGAKEAITMMVEKLEPAMQEGSHIALLNNLGGTSVLEMQILAHELVESPIGGRLSHLIGPATMMSSLDMRGFSISVYPANDEDIAALNAPCSVLAWPGINSLQEINITAMPDGLTPQSPAPSDDPATRALLMTACEAMIAAESDLNALDAKSGDGDTGSTLAGAARALMDTVDHLPLADPAQLYHAIGRELSQTMGGSSGVLLAIFFAAAGDAASNGGSGPKALQAGLRRMQEIGGAKPGDRTMIDALAPALEAMETGLPAAATAARKAADATASMVKANAGRSAYISASQLEGHVDPGAEAVARLFEVLAKPRSD